MRPVLFLLLSFALLAPRPASAGLKEAALALPPELAAVPRWPVAGRQGWKLLETLTFERYRVQDVRRSFTRGGDLQFLFYAGSKRRQRFDFTLAEEGLATWRGQAETNLRRRALRFDFDTELRNKSGFAVRLTALDPAAGEWTLRLAETRDRPLEGTLASGGQTLAVRGTRRLAGTALLYGETSGYVVEQAGRPVAAVEVINAGAVWVDPALEPATRGPVVAALAALLLFEELRPTLPE